ncbi:hypothetical protein HNY73_008144 [Argiope bruennichi]|uniref:Uncharacterized protein n=1 Tax=Argiope bruennichi TaxID=94029 RepID=A0A8T0F7X3_ARGBR|nr:hypothetical protein HNY73_008144 [Argiope bruennichi]
MTVAEEAIYSSISSPQVAMILAVCTFVPFIIYLIYKFSIKEKSFEEVLEEQKRRSLEEELRQKSDKTKKEKKFKRSWAKKKEKAEPEPTSEPPQVEVKKEIPIIEIIEPVEVKAPKQKGKKSAEQNSESNHVDKTKKAEVAVGAEKQEKKEESEKVKASAKSAKVEKEAEKVKAVSKPVETVKPKEEVVVEKSAPSNPPQASVSASTSSKKKKKEPVEKDVAPLTASKVLSLIKDAELDTEEIQNLIDILLNKQKDSTKWTKRNDQLADAKKSLHEREQQLDLELRQNQAVVSKLKDLRDEYNLLKTKYVTLEKTNQEKINKQHQEIQTYATRLKQVQDQCAAEKEKFAQDGGLSSGKD